MTWTSLKLKSFALWSTLSREYKDNSNSGAKHVQITFITGLTFKICRELLNSIKITNNLTTKHQKVWIDPLSKWCIDGKLEFEEMIKIICLKMVQMNFFTKQSHRSRKQFYGYQWESQSVSSVAQSCLTLCDPMDFSMPGFPIHHQLPERAQTHVHQVSNAIQPSHPLLSASPPAFNLSQNQGFFQWVSSLHQVAKVMELQLQHQSFQWIFRIDFL